MFSAASLSHWRMFEKTITAFNRKFYSYSFRKKNYQYSANHTEQSFLDSFPNYSAWLGVAQSAALNASAQGLLQEKKHTLLIL